MKWLVLVVWIAAAWSPPARADDSPQTAAATYVSDKFKLVARRLVEQVAASKLQDACGDDRPVCKLVIDRLAAVFVAAIEKDQAGVKDALVGFFTDSAVHGALELATAALFDGPRIAEVRDIAVPLTTCLGAYLAQNRPPAGCEMKEVRKRVARTFSLDFAGACGDNDCLRIRAFVADVEAGRTPGVSEVIYLLEAAASRIGHDDIRIYLDELHRFLQDGPGIEGGMFEAVEAFLRAPDPSLVTTAIARYDPAGYAGPPVSGQGMSLMYPIADAQWRPLRAACPELDRAFKAWQDARDAGKFFVTAKLALATRQRIDLSALDALLAARCSGDTRELTRFVSQLVAPLRVHNLSARGVALLAAAALLDYLRFQDGDRLDRDVRALVAFALERAMLPAQVQALRAKLAATENLVTSLWETCEALDLRHLLTFTDTDAAPVACRSVVPGGPSLTRTVAGVHGRSTSEVVAARQADLKNALERVQGAVATRVPELDHVVEEVSFAELSKVLRYIAGGDGRAARQVALRHGITLLVDEVDRLSERMLGTRASGCEAAARSTSIFSGMGAACAAHILIQSAYYPIADFLWDTGLSASNVSAIGALTYKSLLQNKALDRTPIILNLGLGVNVFRSGAPALTVVDKFGLAAYKYSEDRWTFETGPFVGGFLDALVRTTTGDGKDRRSWLAGWTVGFPRMAGVDIGFEVHLGAAMPFEIKADDIGFVAGATLVVPFSTLFQSGD